MHLLLFIGYSCLCIYGIIKIPFVRGSGIRPVFLLLFFALHVLTGLAHNIIAYRYYPEHGDIWNFQQWSFIARHRLTTPSEFALFLSDNDTLAHITHNGILWVYMLLDLLSFDNMTINTLLFSFPAFLGNIALFRLFRRRLPNAPLAACTVFLLPSALFWTSVIHREAVIYTVLGFLFYGFDRLLAPSPALPAVPNPAIPSRRKAITIPSPQKSITTPSRRNSIINCCICFILILYFRFSILLSLVPALTAWWLIEKPWPRRRLLAFTGAAILLLFLSILLFPDFYVSLARAITYRQQEFSGLEGHSRLPLPAMTGTWSGIFKVLPSAIRNGLFEPLPGSGGQPIYLAFSLELLGIWLIIAAVLVRRFIGPSQPASLPTFQPQPTFPGPPAAPFTAGQARSTPFIVSSLLFALSGLLFIGAIVPFAGSIVRYRSIFLPFLLAPALYFLHPLPLIRRIDNWLSRHLFSMPRSGNTPLSY